MCYAEDVVGKAISASREVIDEANNNIVNNMTSRSYSLNAIHSITSAITGIQFLPSGGNLDTGTIKLFGIS